MAKEVDPRMHTAEHILNQTMVRQLGTKRCFSAHIEKKKSKCDYHFDRDLSESEIGNIEKKIDDLIQADLVVSEELASREEAKKNYNLSRLPEEVNELRIIKVGDYDACPCIGKHVKSTIELVSFKIISTSYDNGVLRVRFKLPQK